MAINFQRVSIACGIPAIIAIISFYWLRNRKKLLSTNQSSQSDILMMSQSTVNNITNNNNMNSNNTTNETRIICISSNSNENTCNTFEDTNNLNNIKSINNFENNNLMTNELTISVDNSSDSYSKSYDHQMTNSYNETDGYHSYPESVTTSAADQHGEEGSPQSNFSDNRSEGSSDSGKGGSDILHGNCSSASCSKAQLQLLHNEPVINYLFEIPQEYCGRLIGHHGHHVHKIKDETNTRVVINLHPWKTDRKICTLEGTNSQIRAAIEMIRRRFPLKDFPDLTLQQFNLISQIPYPLVSPPPPLQLPSGILCDVILSCTVNAGHFFLQQPTHPTYTSLTKLDQLMLLNYSQCEAPLIPHIQSGMLCAVPIWSGWYRGLVVSVFDNEECQVLFVDYGGYSRLPTSSLRQIRGDFISLPFQASECYLAGVVPVDDENGWSDEANELFEELAQGQILHAEVVGYSENNIPLVNLYKIQGISNVFINQELVTRNCARWLNDA